LGTCFFIHSPYIINLCTPLDTQLLIKNLTYATRIGARGVVVHVGKSTTQPLDTALETMRTNLQVAMEHATFVCPILLETPAGQGTEVLCTLQAFVGFVEQINDPRLRICVDTCHVFACGHDPNEYIQQTPTDLIKLIHFNDSAAACGSCLDRHALVGEGHIGLETMTAIAEYAKGRSIPMLIE
jgi:deoxyribonuclease-4